VKKKKRTKQFRSTCRPIASPLALLLVLGLLLDIVGGQSARADNHAEENHPSAEACALAGRWLDPGTGKALDARHLLSRMSKKAVVLLGESHTMNEDHLWQAQTLSGLLAYQPNLAVGFEMFPRSVQTVLNAWAKGSLSEHAFLKNVGWNNVWGYDSDFYMSLFNIVRQNRLPMIAINVERTLVSRVGAEGWAAIPPTEREGVTDPSPAAKAYRQTLAKVYQMERLHSAPAAEKSDPDEGAAEQQSKEKVSLKAVMESDGFSRFVDAQLTWDRAMAEALANARTDNPKALVVGVVGRGHIENRYGIPHQLDDLGIKDVAVLLPVEIGDACESMSAGVADAIFLVDKKIETEHPPEKPKLGVQIKAVDNGLRVIKVLDDSIAQTATLSVGDIIVKAAGRQLAHVSDLIEIIQRHAPGTWLPLDILRGDQKLEIIAKFPQIPENLP